MPEKYRIIQVVPTKYSNPRMKSADERGEPDVGNQLYRGSPVEVHTRGHILAHPVVIVRPALDATEHVIEGFLWRGGNGPRIFDHPVWDLRTQLRRNVAAPQHSEQ